MICSVCNMEEDSVKYRSEHDAYLCHACNEWGNENRRENTDLEVDEEDDE